MHKKILQDYPKGLKNIRLKIYDGAFYSSWLIRSYKDLYDLSYDLYDLSYDLRFVVSKVPPLQLVTAYPL